VFGSGSLVRQGLLEGNWFQAQDRATISLRPGKSQSHWSHDSCRLAIARPSWRSFPAVTVAVIAGGRGLPFGCPGLLPAAAPAAGVRRVRWRARNRTYGLDALHWMAPARDEDSRQGSAGQARARAWPPTIIRLTGSWLRPDDAMSALCPRRPSARRCEPGFPGQGPPAPLARSRR
jgi:hypothetical protein